MIVDPDSPVRRSFGETKTELWYIWAEIAVDHEATAVKARAAAQANLPNVDKPFGPLEIEVKSTIVTIAAAAHALDAFATAAREAGVIDPSVVTGWRSKRTPRHGQIHQTICRTFAVGPRCKVWALELKWLFELRDETVHFRADWSHLQRHPLGFDTTRVAATYCLEAGNRAVSLMLDIIALATSRPKADPHVERWCRAWAHVGPELSDRRGTS